MSFDTNHKGRVVLPDFLAKMQRLLWILCCCSVLAVSSVRGQNIRGFPDALMSLPSIEQISALDGGLAAAIETQGIVDSLKNGLTASDGAVDPVCIKDLSMLITGVIEKQTWALKFIDALGKLPSGLLDGDLLWFGGFSECRSIVVNQAVRNSSETLFTGRYCLASIANKTATDASQPLAVMLHLGVCVPSTCNETDVVFTLNQVLSLVSADYAVLQINCKTEQRPLTSEAIAVIVVLSLFAFLAVSGTGYDVFVHRRYLVIKDNHQLANSYIRQPVAAEEAAESENSPLLHHGVLPPLTVAIPERSLVGEVLLCFSLINNGKKILAVHEKREQTLTALHGIRFISMSWVILGHSVIFGLSVMRNPVILLNDYVKRFTFQAILNASVSVDTFFLLSGILASYLLLHQIHKSGGPKNVNWALVYFHRFWRLTPAYMLVLAIYTTLFVYMGNGPMYPEVPDDKCQKNWWQNLLYINNLVDQKDGCMGWMWYIANDMQFFIISPLIIVALYNLFLIGLISVIALLLMNIVVVWVLTEKYHYIADTGGMNFLNATNYMDWFNEIYVRPYCRVGVYAVGLAVGYILWRMKTRPRIHALWVTAGWLVAAVCCLSVLYGLYGVASGDRVLSSGVTSLYSSTHRIVWGVGVSWVIFACTTGYGGPVQSFLSWRALVPLSRLTYMAYLIHPVTMTWFYATVKEPLLFSDTTISLLFVFNLTFAYAVAFVLSLTLEAPLIALGKLLLPQKHR